MSRFAILYVTIWVAILFGMAPLFALWLSQHSWGLASLAGIGIFVLIQVFRGLRSMEQTFFAIQQDLKG